MSAAMLETDPVVEELLRAQAPRAQRRLPARELATEGAFAAGLVLAVAALAFLAPPHPSSQDLGLVTAGLVVLYALAERVRFTVGAGGGSAAQLAFVPLLVLVPPALVPVLVVVALNLSRLPEFLRRTSHPDRALLTIGDAWFAVGPALVLTVLPPGEPTAGDWWIYALCLVAQLGVDAVVSSAREWLASGVAPGLQLRLHGIVFLVDATLAPVALVIAIAAVDRPVVLLALVPLMALLALLARERERRIAESLALSEAYRGSALLMGEMLEADDPYTGGEHSQGVVALALAVGRHLQLDARAQRQLEFGALLHDIGKLRTPSEIINKPGALTDEEWAIVRRHPVDGQAMLDRIGGTLAEVGRIVRAHHERFDGHGYPDRLLGAEIPLAARIISACDAFSAMTTNRPYRAAMPVADAIAELERCSGAQFDPAVVAAVRAVVALELPPRLHEALTA